MNCRLVLSLLGMTLWASLPGDALSTRFQVTNTTPVPVGDLTLRVPFTRSYVLAARLVGPDGDGGDSLEISFSGSSCLRLRRVADPTTGTRSPIVEAAGGANGSDSAKIELVYEGEPIHVEPVEISPSTAVSDCVVLGPSRGIYPLPVPLPVPVPERKTSFEGVTLGMSWEWPSAGIWAMRDSPIAVPEGRGLSTGAFVNLAHPAGIRTEVFDLEIRTNIIGIAFHSNPLQDQFGDAAVDTLYFVDIHDRLRDFVSVSLVGGNPLAGFDVSRVRVERDRIAIDLRDLRFESGQAIRFAVQFRSPADAEPSGPVLATPPTRSRASEIDSEKDRRRLLQSASVGTVPATDFRAGAERFFTALDETSHPSVLQARILDWSEALRTNAAMTSVERKAARLKLRDLRNRLIDEGILIFRLQEDLFDLANHGKITNILTAPEQRALDAVAPRFLGALTDAIPPQGSLTEPDRLYRWFGDLTGAVGLFATGGLRRDDAINNREPDSIHVFLFYLLAWRAQATAEAPEAWRAIRAAFGQWLIEYLEYYRPGLDLTPKVLIDDRHPGGWLGLDPAASAKITNTIEMMVGDISRHSSTPGVAAPLLAEEGGEIRARLVLDTKEALTNGVGARYVTSLRPFFEIDSVWLELELASPALGSTRAPSAALHRPEVRRTPSASSKRFVSLPVANLDLGKWQRVNLNTIEVDSIAEPRSP